MTREKAYGHRAGVRQEALGLRPGSKGARRKFSRKWLEFNKLRGYRTQKKHNGRKPKTKK